MLLNNHSVLFRLICHFLKFFFLFTFGLATFCVLASLLEAVSLALWVIYLVKGWWLRIALGSLVTLGYAIMFESVQ